eukprot:403369506
MQPRVIAFGNYNTSQESYLITQILFQKTFVVDEGGAKIIMYYNEIQNNFKTFQSSTQISANAFPNIKLDCKFITFLNLMECNIIKGAYEYIQFVFSNVRTPSFIREVPSNFSLQFEVLSQNSLRTDFIVSQNILIQDQIQFEPSGLVIQNLTNLLCDMSQIKAITGLDQYLLSLFSFDVQIQSLLTTDIALNMEYVLNVTQDKTKIAVSICLQRAQSKVFTDQNGYQTAQSATYNKYTRLIEMAIGLNGLVGERVKLQCLGYNQPLVSKDHQNKYQVNQMIFTLVKENTQGMKSALVQLENQVVNQIYNQDACPSYQLKSSKVVIFVCRYSRKPQEAEASSPAHQNAQNAGIDTQRNDGKPVDVFQNGDQQHNQDDSKSEENKNNQSIDQLVGKNEQLQNKHEEKIEINDIDFQLENQGGQQPQSNDGQQIIIPHVDGNELRNQENDIESQGQ